MSHPWLRGYSTAGMISPFKIPLQEQNIYISMEENKKHISQFMEDMNIIVKDKAFFSRSFVNKTLVEKLQAETI